MRSWGLAVVAAVALTAALPASASHHALTFAPGDVTLTASKEGAKSVRFHYTISPHTCDGLPLCYPNYGKPYHISLSVSAGGAPAFRGIPSLVSGPAGCFAATQPVVVCDSGKRDTDDPSAVLPLDGSLIVRGIWANGATAAIIAEGFNVNSHQEGVPMPPAPCTAESDAVDRMIDQARRASDDVIAAQFAYREHVMPKVLSSRLDELEPGFLIVTAQLLNNVLRAKADFLKAVKDLKRAQAALDDCEKGKAPRAPSANGDCSVPQWSTLGAAAAAFKPRDVGALGRKVRAERKANSHTAFARDLKRLRETLRSNVKKMNALQKVLKTCA